MENLLPTDTFTTNLHNFQTTRYVGPLVIRGHSKTSKIRPFNRRNRFYLMEIVARVTPETDDARISDNSQRF